MTLDEAIQHAQEIANKGCDQCAKDHQQLAEWLTELKQRREADEVKPKTIYDAEDGDIMYYNGSNELEYVIIFESFHYPEYGPADGINHYIFYCPTEDWFDQSGRMHINYWEWTKLKYATDEQKQTLFDALKKYGHAWDPENKKLN